MQATRLPAARGWAWMVEGFALYRRNPALLTFLVFGYWLGLLLVGAVPFIGQVAVSLVMPALSLGILNGCREIAAGRKPGPDILFSGFRTNLPALLRLGVVYLLGSLAVLGFTALVDGGVLFELMLGRRPLSEETAEDPRVMAAMLTGIAVSTPLMMAYWFAPLLAGWKGLPAGKAMFFSLVACWRNWQAFMVFALALAGVALVPGFLIGLLGAISPIAGALPALILPLVVIPVLFASFYINARDVFGDFDALDTPAASGGDAADGA
ncbi:MAG: hypothetical protein HGA47_02510 [Zoogloea sp.]|nr:hypothetical protein [Zoogloea sp.]